MSKRGRRAKRPRHFFKRLSYDERRVYREAAFAAIKKLYAASLPLWRYCPRGVCRRHKICAGDDGCLKRVAPLLPGEVWGPAMKAVEQGGPKRIPPANPIERALRNFPPSNFIH